MIWIASKINEDYGIVLSMFNKLRDLKDGLSICEFTINWDRYLDDHTPRFDIMFIICNIKIFEFSIYYLHHRDNTNE